MRSACRMSYISANWAFKDSGGWVLLGGLFRGGVALAGSGVEEVEGPRASGCAGVGSAQGAGVSVERGSKDMVEGGSGGTVVAAPGAMSALWFVIGVSLSWSIATGTVPLRDVAASAAEEGPRVLASVMKVPATSNWPSRRRCMTIARLMRPDCAERVSESPKGTDLISLTFCDDAQCESC